MVKKISNILVRLNLTQFSFGFDTSNQAIEDLIRSDDNFQICEKLSDEEIVNLVNANYNAQEDQENQICEGEEKIKSPIKLNRAKFYID